MGKKKIILDINATPSWMATFSDLLTLLLTFYVLLLTMSSMDVLALKEFIGFFRGAIAGLEKGAYMELQRPQPVPPRASSLSGTYEGTGTEVKFKTRDAYISTAQKAILRSLRKLLSKRASLRVSMLTSKSGLVMVFPGPNIFQKGTDIISTPAIPVLNKIGKTLKQKTFLVIRIEGHSDHSPLPEGSPFSSNWEISTARAAKLLSFFIEEAGIEPDRLSCIGYGPMKPRFMSPKLVKEGKNNRMEIIISERQKETWY